MKKNKFYSLFKNKSFFQLYNIGGDLDKLFDLLTEEEIDKLVELNVQFIRSCSPSSTIILQDLIVNGRLTIINVDVEQKKVFTPKEFIAILLHEIGHVFNPGISGIEAEYAADNFVNSKGYASSIKSGLERGLKNNLSGFEQISCDLRIDNLLKTK
ncbi:hypothetical protein [Ferruginibacter sp. SUN106]|uniref:hypothetical protein n=1 Tax=Ferruginibacter sp. SUN106 TaxID=2978348 RepID=UPI003D36EDEE